MNNLPLGIDEKYRRAEPVENVGKCGRFRLAKIDYFAGANRTADMRHDKTHPTAHLFIDHAALFVPYDAEICATRGGFFQHGICRIDPALRLRPFAVETARPKFIIGNEIGNTDDLLDIAV